MTILGRNCYHIIDPRHLFMPGNIKYRMLHVRDPRMLEQPECYHSWRSSLQKEFFDFMSFFEKKTSICYPVEGDTVSICVITLLKVLFL